MNSENRSNSPSPICAVVKLRLRVHECGIRIGRLEAGERNSITDVRGVSVGQVTLIRGEGKLTPGRGPVRTGVTVVLPHEGNIFREKLRAGVHVQNGAGELTGALQVMEWGVMETPIALTNSLNVGLVHDALVEYMVQRTPEIGREGGVILPIVGECDDSYLNDIQGRHVKHEHVLQAAESATEKVAEGSVGAGTGMSALGFKAGIGTASRRTDTKPDNYTVGALVLANFSGDLHVDGVPVHGQIETVNNLPRSSRSIITVLATDRAVDLNAIAPTGSSCALGAGLGRVYVRKLQRGYSHSLLNHTTNRHLTHPDSTEYQCRKLGGAGRIVQGGN